MTLPVTLPPWAEKHPTNDNAVLVDPDLMYPAMLADLGVKPEQATKYWIETAFQMAKLDLQVAMRRYNFTIHVRGDDGRKDRWGLHNFPGDALQVVMATKGQQARQHYLRVRGFLPGH